MVKEPVWASDVEYLKKNLKLAGDRHTFRVLRNVVYKSGFEKNEDYNAILAEIFEHLAKNLATKQLTE